MRGKSIVIILASLLLVLTGAYYFMSSLYAELGNPTAGPNALVLFLNAIVAAAFIITGFFVYQQKEWAKVAGAGMAGIYSLIAIYAFFSIDLIRSPSDFVYYLLPVLALIAVLLSFRKSSH